MPKYSLSILLLAGGGGGNRIGFLSYTTHLKPKIEPISETHTLIFVINSNNGQIVNRVSRHPHIGLNLVLTPNQFIRETVVLTEY
jgi:hypothetical protein